VALAISPSFSPSSLAQQASPADNDAAPFLVPSQTTSASPTIEQETASHFKHYSSSLVANNGTSATLDKVLRFTVGASTATATVLFSILAACGIGVYAYCCFSRVRRSQSFSFSYGPVPSNIDEDEGGGYDRQAGSYVGDSGQWEKSSLGTQLLD
jgi:hypothetical protein